MILYTDAVQRRGLVLLEWEGFNPALYMYNISTVQTMVIGLYTRKLDYMYAIYISFTPGRLIVGTSLSRVNLITIFSLPSRQILIATYVLRMYCVCIERTEVLIQFSPPFY